MRHVCNVRFLIITVADDDGDIVRCRWANNNNGSTECYSVCHGVPGASIDEVYS